ncbi:unnamed protein product [Prorocentrum cordatum]|uniref:Subtilisin n=1 Tax=Prorocentrum cordatum TaxID=2364126 RepID=A0ABN9Q081_9DINO|nr:unnamed protein product [Polarella glacialis]
MTDREAQEVLCPSGYFGTVALLCAEGNVSVEAVQCQATRCEEAEVIVGGQAVQHPDMAEGETIEYPNFCDKCQTGALTLNCTATGVEAVSSNCRLSRECCAPGGLLNSSLVYPMLEDGEVYPAVCTGGLVGTVWLRCSSSVVSRENLSESCSPACPAGLLDTGGISIAIARPRHPEMM